ncbi:WXG100 family type VII secretion target [Corynebacterium pseudotuberculosis]|nr:WXG100 family type VII secretion target [Corynebacterium pseudotuberculosis]ADK28194.1 WXG100 family type VII secretion target [Corynebacterium pseudotuberculosis FRC41]ADL20303.1 WXG100 family type VII secretion target [Corynebacterium pseudotuberculosis 1002]AEK91738.1 WXG domain-containing protein [Corynebacterium pseudotuberculosis PAT10]AJC13139.1 WXG domain-containing protein [Corynebacterium pseudotuberculosis]AKJ55072.1 WXG domain-containing protein [Corynebacterium pseudotuberculos
MSGQFRTEADVMVATASRVDNTNAEVQSELARLRGIVDGVRGSWAGSAQASFDNLMQRWDASAGKLRMALQSISDNIRSNATSFDQTEADNKAAFASVGAQGLTLITNI